MFFALRQKNKKKNIPLGFKLRDVIIAVSALTFAGLFYAYCSLQALNISYQISKNLETQRELIETGKRLIVELNNLRSLDRLEKESAKLGLMSPKPDQLRRLN